MPKLPPQLPDVSSNNSPQQDVVKATIQPLTVSVKTTSILLSICERTVWDLIRDGSLPSIRIGSRVLVVYQDIIDFIRKNTDTSGALVRPDRARSLSNLNRSRRFSLQQQEEA